MNLTSMQKKASDEVRSIILNSKIKLPENITKINVNSQYMEDLKNGKHLEKEYLEEYFNMIDANESKEI